MEFESTKIVAVHRSPGFKWAYGSIKGGTTPLVYGNHLLSFFHSTLDNEPPPYRRRYYIGAVTFENTPPFAVVSVSKEPILFGSEVDDSSEIERSACSHRKEKVVFPVGSAWASPDAAWLSYGVNDCQCAISTVKDFKL